MQLEIISAFAAFASSNSSAHYDDDDDGERLSISNAAEIWRSHGEDENYVWVHT